MHFTNLSARHMHKFGSALICEKLYMNPFTGRLATGKQWMEDQLEMCFSVEDLSFLIEVNEKNKEVK